MIILQNIITQLIQTKKSNICIVFKRWKQSGLLGKKTYSGVITLHDIFEDQLNLKKDIDNFSENVKPKN